MNVGNRTKVRTLSLRLTPELKAAVEAAQAAHPYSTSITAIVERGIVLAIREMAEMAKVAK